ncbi:MAG: hypothetical protein ACQESR_30620 [Planctomycetota bacterium]
MESCSTQAVLPLVGLAADNVIRDPYSRKDRLYRFSDAGRHDVVGSGRIGLGLVPHAGGTGRAARFPGAFGD